MEARARRAAAAVGVAIALVAGVGALYLRPWQALPARPAPTASPQQAFPPVAVQQAQFLSATTGWVVTGVPSSSSLFHTTDAGRHWQRQLEGVAGNGWTLSFFDARRGVVIAANQHGPELLRTTDGGRHWTVRTSATCTAPQLIFFLDADHGWCVAPYGDPVGGQSLLSDRQEIGLYRTTDGAATWTRVLATTPPRPVAGGLSDEGYKSWIWFADASHGWIGEHASGGRAVVYATSDAGDDWNRQELPPPAGGWGSTVGFLEDTPPPRSSGASLPAVVVATLEPGPRQGVSIVDGRYVYTWQAPVWKGPIEVPSGPVTLADGAHWFVVMGTSVLESTDGGVNWTTMGAPPPGWVIDHLTMVDQDHGWTTLLRLPLSGSPISPTGLARTADAGRHWTVVALPS